MAELAKASLIAVTAGTVSAEAAARCTSNSFEARILPFASVIFAEKATWAVGVGATMIWKLRMSTSNWKSPVIASAFRLT